MVKINAIFNQTIMKKSATLLVLAIVLFALWGCPNHSKFKYPKAYFPEKPVNLSSVNSEYDDYNSALPETHYGRELIFSSNRSSEGENFDIYGDKFHAAWYMETGILQVDNSDYWQNNTYVTQMLNIIDKQGDQFAPYAVSFDTTINDTVTRMNLIAYSTNDGSYSFFSKFVLSKSTDGGTTNNAEGPFDISYLGDNMQQQYISFFGNNVMNIDYWEINPNLFTEMYFDCKESGVSNIGKIQIPDSLNFIQFLTSKGEYEKTLIDIVNSSSNDRCPFVNGWFMVFASDRPGGYGGFDLYYSRFENGEWTEPVNFGEKINSEFDEFRPIVVQVYNFENDLMIFSSDRPGGLGGFDLYYVGIPKINPIVFVE